MARLFNPKPMPPRLLALLVFSIMLALLALTSCSPAVRVAKYYRRYTAGYHKQQRKPLHHLPNRSPLD